MAKFLIIRFSSIGDIVLTSPVARCLRKKIPEAEIHFLTKESFKVIVADNPYIDHVHILGEDFNAMLEELKAERFDYIIDLHHNLRTLRIKWFLKTKAFSFNKLNIEKFIYTNLKINTLPKKHIVDRNLETLHHFGVENDGLGLDYFIPDKDIVPWTVIPDSHRQGYIAIVIGASFLTKRLPVHKMQKLCAAIGHPVILLGGEEDIEAGEAIAAIDNTKIYNACGKFNLNQSSDLARKAKLVVAHDTGLMHISAALQKPIISIWGNTVPAFGMYPYFGSMSAQKYAVVEVNNLSCRPCSKIGYKKCPRGHFKCMENINIAQTLALIDEYLAASEQA